MTRTSSNGLPIGAGDARYVKKSGDTMTGVLNTTSAGIAGTGTQTLASNLYIQSRGMNLFSNGSGLLGNNYNMSFFAFDQSDTHGGKGSFKLALTAAPQNDELIPVDGTKTYKLSTWLKSTTYVAGNHAYLGIVGYDIDGLSIQTYHFMRAPGSDTYLTQAITPGDTEVHINNATGWLGNGVNAYQREIIIWNYANSFGYTYPEYTYSRNTTYNYTNYKNNGAWAVGGITGNVITLTEPWPASMGTIPNGTAVSDGSAGASYKYITNIYNTEIPNSWLQGSGSIGGWDTTGTNAVNSFPYGTAYIKIYFSLNRDVTGNATNVSDIWFSELTANNIEVATTTQQGVVSTTTQSFAGNKTFTGNVGIGTTAPDKKLEVNLGTSNALRLTYNDANGSAAVYADLTLSSTGTLTITPVGSAPAVAFAAPARLKGYTVATLPTGVQGNTAFVTDALAPAFLVAVVGGGAVISTVFHNGTTWVAQ